jgi:hypothetical protein
MRKRERIESGGKITQHLMPLCVSAAVRMVELFSTVQARRFYGPDLQPQR